MRKNVLRISALLLGSALVISSCVKTEELDSVKAIREAKAAGLLASANLTNANAKSALASAAWQEYLTYKDSTQFALNLPVFAANAQTALEQAKGSLINAQYNTLNNQNSLDILKNSNSVLARLVGDYNSYYYGGGSISRGIFDLKIDILGYKGSIIDLQTSKDAAKTLLAQDQTNLKSDSAKLKVQISLLKFYTDAQTNAIGTSLEDAKTALATATNEYQTAKIAYDNYQPTLQAAQTASSDAGAAVTANATEMANAQFNVTTALSGYSNSFEYLQMAYNLAVTTTTDKKAVLDTWTKANNDSLAALNSSKTALATAQQAYDVAHAALLAAQINGATAPANIVTAESNASTALSNAQTAKDNHQSNYDVVYANYKPAKDAYDNAVTAQNNIKVNNIDKYNEFKPILDAAKAKVNSLAATAKSASDALTLANKTNTTLSNTLSNASTKYTAYTTLVSDLQDPASGINSKITACNNNIDSYNSSIAALNKEIAQLTAGYYSGTMLDEKIKWYNEKITETQVLIDTYTTKAAALKVKIDAAQ